MITREKFYAIIFLLQLFFSGCERKDDASPAQETGTVTDIEGNVYKTIKIGSQWWMAENLKVKKYRNGMFVQHAPDSADWVTRETGAYCVFENGTSQSPAPGLLYNGFAATDTSGLAPAGWHIPTDAEWKALEESLGMSTAQSNASGWRGTNEADKLKIASPDGWSAANDIWSTNESGFTALAGSCRLPNADYGAPGLFATGFWWTSSGYGGAEAWYRYLDYKKSTVFRSRESKRYGFSVRCVKD